MALHPWAGEIETLDLNDIDQMAPNMIQRGSFGAQAGIKISETQVLKVFATRNLARDAEFAALPMDLRDDDTWLLNMDHEAAFNKENLRSWKTSHREEAFYSPSAWISGDL